MAMIKGFERKELGVKDCCTYTAIRTASSKESDVVEFFNILRNCSDPVVQQINVSRSKLDVIRGTHISGFPKVIFCPTGRVYDVVVDCRPDSPTFRQWCGAWLDRDTHIVCPEFCAHGIFAGEEDSVICYYQNGTFFDKMDYPVNGFDPTVGVKWPETKGDKYVMSQKDLTSKGADEELFAKIKYRIDDPVGAMHTLTNSEIVVCGKYIDYVTAFAKHLGKLDHILPVNAVNRETFAATLRNLRPKTGIIYFVCSEDPASIAVEVGNVISVCHEYKERLVLIYGEPCPVIDMLFELDEFNHMNMVRIAASCLQSSAKSGDAVLDVVAGKAVEVLKCDLTGSFRFTNPGLEPLTES